MNARLSGTSAIAQISAEKIEFNVAPKIGFPLPAESAAPATR
jgi:hypothetical protein